MLLVVEPVLSIIYNNIHTLKVSVSSFLYLLILNIMNRKMTYSTELWPPFFCTLA